MSDDVTVLVVDDERIIREGLAAILAVQDGLSVVGSAGDGEEAVDLCLRLRPDVVMLDIRMPRRDGLWVLRELGRHGLLGPGPRGVHVLVLTTFGLDEYVDQALLAGAAGFLLKNSSYEELTAAVRAVAAGQRTLSPAVTDRIVESHLSARRQPDSGDLDRLSGLTSRERDVLRLVGDGLSNAEIADRLVVSLHTVKTHVSRMLAKTGCHSRAQAAVLARRTLR
ncbi:MULTISPECIES: response regulator [unclassified Streptomyces]|uniref:response regulator n=1 Tax=unclassified Streptomyces TaxID=2593676 RepID=UPI0037F68539